MAKQIRFANEMHPSTPFYVFDSTGGSDFVKAGNPIDGWVGAHIDRGDVIGRYPTLSAARDAHPDAHVTKLAFDAVDSGYYQ